MPLKQGKSKKIFEENLRELLRAFRKKGRIGRIKPQNKKHALRIALAIAFAQQRRSK